MQKMLDKPRPRTASSNLRATPCALGTPPYFDVQPQLLHLALPQPPLPEGHHQQRGVEHVKYAV